jgi:hypothetical protein
MTADEALSVYEDEEFTSGFERWVGSEANDVRKRGGELCLLSVEEVCG